MKTEQKVEAYKQQLEARNGYCSCPRLSELTARRKETEALEAMCQRFCGEADFENLRREDLQFYNAYKKAEEGFQAAVANYYAVLNELAKDKKIVFSLHDVKKEKRVGRITYDTALDILQQPNSDIVITAHCASCDQQIEIAR